MNITKRAQRYTARQIVRQWDDGTPDGTLVGNAMLHAWQLLVEFRPTLDEKYIRELAAEDKGEFFRKVLESDERK